MIKESDIKFVSRFKGTVSGAAVTTFRDDNYGVRKEIIEKGNEITERFYINKNKGVFRTLKDAVDFLNKE